MVHSDQQVDDLTTVNTCITIAMNTEECYMNNFA